MRRWRLVSRWTRGVVSAVAATAAGAFAAAAQEGAAAGPVGTVSGQVVNVDTKVPLQNAMVLITGTKLGASTNAEGRFVIRNVPAGSHTVRVQLLGFSPVEQAVTVAAGQTATVDIALKEVPYTPRSW